MTEEKEEEKTQKDENYEKAALYVAFLLGMYYKSFDDLKAHPNDLQKVNVKIHENKNLLDQIQTEEKISDKDIQKEAIKATEMNGKLMKIRTVGDQKVCPKCAEWQGKIISVDGSDKNYPSMDDFIKSGGYHVNCRCSAQEIDTDEIPLKQEINPRYKSRKQARPDLYNHTPLKYLVFN